MCEVCVKCEVWGVWSMRCSVVWGVGCVEGMRSVKCEEWSVRCGMRCRVWCGVQCVHDV